MVTDGAVWAVHCNVDLDLVGGGYAAMGPDELGDVSGLAADRTAFKQVMAAARPDKKPGTIAQWAGQLYRFIHEAAVGDLIRRHGRGLLAAATRLVGEDRLATDRLPVGGAV